MGNTIFASHSVGKVFGIEVRVLYLLYGIIGLWAFMDVVTLGPAWGLLTLTTLLFLPVFVFLHELGHSLAAMRDGVPVRSIHLHPLGGQARLGGAVPGPLSEIQIALAGPFVSFTLASLFLALLWITTGEPRPVFGGTVWLHLLSAFLVMNAMLGLFNLLPVFPMDGGRVASAALVMKYGPEKGVRYTLVAARIGLGLLAAAGIVMLVLGNTHGVMLVLIAALLYVTGDQELAVRRQMGLYMDADGRTPARGVGAEPWRSSLEKVYDPLLEENENVADEEDAEPGAFERWREERKRKKDEQRRRDEETLRRDVDDILRKVRRDGLASLTPEERETLEKASKSFRE